MPGEPSQSRSPLWVNGSPPSPPQEDQGEPSGTQRGWMSSQDLQPTRKGKEPEGPSASDGTSTDGNNSSSRSTDRSDEPTSTAQETPPELSPHSYREITGNDGTRDSNQRQVEKLKADLAEEKTKRARLEDRIAQFEAVANSRNEERRRWESESSRQLTSKDLLDGKNKQWQEAFNNLRQRCQEFVEEKHQLEIQLHKANATIKRLERQIRELNDRLEKSEEEVKRLNAKLHQRNAQTEDSKRTESQNEQQGQDRRSPSPAQEGKSLSTSSQELWLLMKLKRTERVGATRAAKLRRPYRKTLKQAR
ncbi:hypothetical protein BKA61DRAFT_98582 [Leptodontidium sp. MPI-SDFR-AT-0119]|nr:hypothetical protein BKA61DRAFT_98582 [Leptodontidium sp. MPI-SDFR-AT-0119]